MAERNTDFGIKVKASGAANAETLAAAVNNLGAALHSFSEKAQPAKIAAVGTAFEQVNKAFTPSKARNLAAAAVAVSSLATSLAALSQHSNVDVSRLGTGFSQLGRGIRTAAENAPKLTDALVKLDIELAEKKKILPGVSVQFAVFGSRLRAAADAARDLRQATRGGFAGPRARGTGSGGAASGAVGAVGPGGFVLATAAQQRAATRQTISTVGYTGPAASAILPGPMLGPHPLATTGAQLAALRRDFADTWRAGKFGALATSLSVGTLNAKIVDLSANLKAAHDKFRGLGEAGMALKGAGTQLATGGAVVAGGGFLAAMAAGRYRQQERSIEAFSDRSRGDVPGKEFMEQLRQFDRESPVTTFGETITLAQRALGSGFSQQELINKKGTGLFQALNDVLSTTGGNVENFNAAMVQFIQGRGPGVKFTMRDIRALQESGGLPAMRIIQSGLAPERWKSFQEGETLTGQEVIDSFIKGAQKAPYKGGAERVMGELPGQVSNLTSALQQLAVAVGEGLLPPVTAAVEGLTAMADGVKAAFNWPIIGPVLKGLTDLIVVAGAGAVPIGLTLIAVGQLAQAIGALGFIMELQIVTTYGLGGALGRLGLGMLYAAGVAYLLKTAYEGSAAAAKLSNAELEKQYPIWSKVWKLATLVTGIVPTIFEKMWEGITWLLNKISFGIVPRYKTGATQTAELDQRTFEVAQKEREKRGLPAETFEQWQKRTQSYGGGETGGDRQAAAENRAALDNNTRAMGDHAAKMQELARAAAARGDSTATTGGEASEPGQIAGGADTGTSSVAGAALPVITGVGSSLNDYRALQLSAAEGDKQAKKQLRLANLQRAWERADAKTRARLVKEEQRAAAEEKTAEGVQQGFDSKADVARLDDLRASRRDLLRQRRFASEAEKGRNDAEIAILEERIARAETAKRSMGREDQERKRAEARARATEREVDREYVQDLRRYLSGLVKAGRASRADTGALLDRITANLSRSRLKMPTLSFTAEMQALFDGWANEFRGEIRKARAENPFVKMWRSQQGGGTAIGALDFSRFKGSAADLSRKLYGDFAPSIGYGSGGRRISVGSDSRNARGAAQWAAEMNTPNGGNRAAAVGDNSESALQRLANLLSQPAFPSSPSVRSYEGSGKLLDRRFSSVKDLVTTMGRALGGLPRSMTYANLPPGIDARFLGQSRQLQYSSQLRGSLEGYASGERGPSNLYAARVLAHELVHAASPNVRARAAGRGGGSYYRPFEEGFAEWQARRFLSKHSSGFSDSRMAYPQWEKDIETMARRRGAASVTQLWRLSDRMNPEGALFEAVKARGGKGQGGAGGGDNALSAAFRPMPVPSGPPSYQGQQDVGAGATGGAAGGSFPKVRNRQSTMADGRRKIEFEPVIIEDRMGNLQAVW